ncbi:hypothetical protein JCM15765_25650 [Paradesulfitobacterium aromaticivorans]
MKPGHFDVTGFLVLFDKFREVPDPFWEEKEDPRRRTSEAFSDPSMQLDGCKVSPNNKTDKTN